MSWRGAFTENDFSTGEKAKRSAIFQAWRGSDTSPGHPHASAASLALQPRTVAGNTSSLQPNISTSPPGPPRPPASAQESPVMVRSQSLEPPSARFRDIDYRLPSQRPAQRGLPELQQPQQVTSSHQPSKMMSSFFGDHAMSDISQDSGQAQAIDPRLSDDTFNGFSSPSAAGHTEDSSSPAPANTVFPSSPTLTLGDVMAANDAATKSAAKGKARQVDSSPLSFDQAAAQGMMPPPPGPGQDGQIPPAQDGLPQEAMARATFNELLGMYTPHVSWHRVDGLDTQYFSREPIETRIRYLFDFMANADGGRLFKERINSNVRIQRASMVNANRHVEVGEQELTILNGLAPDEPVDYPHGGAFRVEGRAAITDKLNTDKFWEDVMGLELRLSELALERVEVARKATIPLYDFQQGLQITPEAAQELEELYAKFQDMRVEAAQLLREILQRVGEGKACSNMLQRHRNELWDIWGGRPGVDSVL